VLARERAVRAELGEESDHHSADEVLAPSIGLTRQRVLKRLQGCLVIAAIPGLEG
jgi:hypothetical protein